MKCFAAPRLYVRPQGSEPPGPATAKTGRERPAEEGCLPEWQLVRAEAARRAANETRLCRMATKVRLQPALRRPGRAAPAPKHPRRIARRVQTSYPFSVRTSTTCRPRRAAGQSWPPESDAVVPIVPTRNLSARPSEPRSQRSSSPKKTTRVFSTVSPPYRLYVG